MSKVFQLKKGVALFLAVCMTAAASMSAMAAEDRTKISSIKLKISSSFEIGSYPSDSDIEVTTTSSYFEVGEIEIQNDSDEWEVGDTPKAKVWLYADGDHYFSTTSSSAFSFSGDKASFVSAKTEDSKSTMVLTFKLGKVEGDLEVEDLEWDEDTATANWGETDGAKSYEVRLYRGSSSVTSTIQVSSDTSYNFSGNITKTGDYSFRVRAIGSSSSNKGEWQESDTWYIDSDLLSSIKSSAGSGAGSSTTTGGSWQQDGIGWWFRNSDGTWPANSWKYINNNWYFFNSNGYMATGWIQWNNSWYYCNVTTGAMLSGVKTPDGFTLGSNGIWLGY